MSLGNSLYSSAVELVRLSVLPLSVPLLEPFAIATGTMHETRSVLVEAHVHHDGKLHVGIGEAAALPPVTECDQPELLQFGRAAAEACCPLLLSTVEALAAELKARVPSPELRGGVEAAVLDAWARHLGVATFELLGAGATSAATSAPTSEAPTLAFVTDITLPIGEAQHMAKLARRYREAGFSSFKVKVGRALDDDVRALEAIASSVPDARFRIDANGGYALAEAQALVKATAHLTLECFEQPCARGAEDDMARLQREVPFPVVADESLRSDDDLTHILASRCARGANLKLAKLGGLVAARDVGRRAQAAGLHVMTGAMVETRLGLSAMLHVAASLGTVTWIDLDTQLLLAEEAFVGGYDGDGPQMTLRRGVGLNVERIAR